MLYKSSKRKVNEPLVRSAPNGLYFKGICFLMLKVKIINYKGGNTMNPYEQLQLNKEVEEMAKQRIEIHKKRIKSSEELENNWNNKEIQDRIIELEEESQKLKKKIEALQANF
jgi:hypothetical protein